jgi:hypothetical protein
MPRLRAQQQMTFAAVGGDCQCGRCGAPCKIDPVPGSQAKMLKRGSTPKGLCINCAVHDQLRHLYPANLTLEQSRGQGLRHPHIQKMFFDLCRMRGTDAAFEEIDWQAIVAHWDLPFPTKLQGTSANPAREEELAMARLEGDQRRAGTYKEPLTEEEYQSRQQEAVDNFLNVVHKESSLTDREQRAIAIGRRKNHEDPPADHRDGG